MPRSSKTGVQGLSRRDDGRFEIDLRWHEPGTGEYRRYREVLAEGVPAAAAKTRAREIVGLALAGGWKPKQRDDRGLKAALKEYVGWRKTNGRAAVKQSEAAAARLVDSLGDICLDEVSPFAVERYKRERREGGAAPATVNRDLALLRHFYRLAATWGWVSKAHAAELREVASLKEPPGRVRYLTADEEARLMAALERRPHLRRLVLAALLTGMRQGEILGLRREAVDLTAQEITLTRTKTNRVRRVPIADALLPAVQEALDASRSGYVFESRRGEPYTRNGLRSAWECARAAAKLEDFHFHDLRHSAATTLRRLGAGLDVIQRLLGHSTIAMTTRYAHVGDDAVREAVGRFPLAVVDGGFARPMPAADGASPPKPRK